MKGMNHQVKGSKGQWIRKTAGHEREIQRQGRDMRDRETLQIAEAETMSQRKRQKTADGRDWLLPAQPPSSSGTENSLADP